MSLGSSYPCFLCPVSPWTSAPPSIPSTLASVEMVLTGDAAEKGGASPPCAHWPPAWEAMLFLLQTQLTGPVLGQAEGTQSCLHVLRQRAAGKGSGPGGHGRPGGRDSGTFSLTRVYFIHDYFGSATRSLTLHISSPRFSPGASGAGGLLWSVQETVSPKGVWVSGC